jgi:TadE-like protein
MRTSNRRPGRRRRGGSVALELLLLTPIVVGLLVGVVELSMMTAANEHLSAASREGARVAALGGTEDDIDRAVQNRLGHARLSQAKVCVFLKDAEGNPIPSGDPVAVRVEVPADEAVPDLLRFIGFSIKNITLVGQTTMRKE